MEGVIESFEFLVFAYEDQKGVITLHRNRLQRTEKRLISTFAPTITRGEFHPNAPQKTGLY